MDAADHVAETKTFLIEGLLHPEFTVLSGEAKVGKSALGLHMVSALQRHEPLLGCAPDGREHLVYWAGTDVGWRTELAGRMKKHGIPHGTIILEEPGIEPREFTHDHWVALRQALLDHGVTLAVFDNLLGFAGETTDLDKTHGVAPFLNELMRLADSGIAVVLIAHAGKGGPFGSSGRAAHSYSIEAKARHLIRVKGEPRGRATLTVGGNHVDAWTMKINLTDIVCEPRTPNGSGDPTPGRLRRQRDRVAIEAAERFLSTAPDWARTSARAAGKWLFESNGLGLGEPPSADAGRALVNRHWLTPELLRRDGTKGQLVAGPSLDEARRAA